MDLDDLFDSRHRHRHERTHHDHHDDAGIYRHDDDHWGHRDARPRHGNVARVDFSAVMSKPWLLAAGLGVLLAVVVAGIWASIQLLGFIGDYGVKGLVEAVLGLGTRLWKGA